MSLEEYNKNFTLHAPDFTQLSYTFLSERKDICHFVSIDDFHPSAGLLDIWCIPSRFSTDLSHLDIWALYPYLLGTFSETTKGIQCPVSNTLRFNQYRWKINSTKSQRKIALFDRIASCPSLKDPSKFLLEASLQNTTEYNLGLSNDTSGPYQTSAQRRTMDKLYNRTVEGLCQKIKLLHKGEHALVFTQCRTLHQNGIEAFKTVTLNAQKTETYCACINNISSFVLGYYLMSSFKEGEDASAFIERSLFSCEKMPSFTVSAASEQRPHYLWVRLLPLLTMLFLLTKN